MTHYVLDCTDPSFDDINEKVIGDIDLINIDFWCHFTFDHTTLKSFRGGPNIIIYLYVDHFFLNKVANKSKCISIQTPQRFLGENIYSLYK